MKNNLSKTSKYLLFVAAIALIISLFVPIWSIYLDAPQYPEGLSLQIWANKIAGDVDIINGLNHYIGMKTLHSADFIEFTVLPYIIIAFVVFFIIVALLAKRKLLYYAFGAFVMFGILAMIDFWKWEYEYGHDLDPNAAIQVPGMAYQPPLIGFKQLLNFGAFSIPDIGGWLFVFAGVLILLALLIETKVLARLSRNKKIAILLPVSLFMFSSCGSVDPEPINLNKDACASCKMSISDGHFGSEIITKKGRVYKFDDMGCMLHYISENEQGNVAAYYINDFSKENVLIDATKAWFIHHESLKSPMGGNIAAFADKADAQKIADEKQISVEDWSTVSNPNHSGHEEHEH